MAPSARRLTESCACAHRVPRPFADLPLPRLSELVESSAVPTGVTGARLAAFLTWVRI